MAEFPEGVNVYPCGGPPPYRDAPWERVVHRFVLDHPELPPFRRHYRAVADRAREAAPG